MKPVWLTSAMRPSMMALVSSSTLAPQPLDCPLLTGLAPFPRRAHGAHQVQEVRLAHDQGRDAEVDEDEHGQERRDLTERAWQSHKRNGEKSGKDKSNKKTDKSSDQLVRGSLLYLAADPAHRPGGDVGCNQQAETCSDTPQRDTVDETVLRAATKAGEIPSRVVAAYTSRQRTQQPEHELDAHAGEPSFFVCWAVLRP